MVSAKPHKPIKQMMSDVSFKTRLDFEFENQYLRNIGGLTIDIFVRIEQNCPIKNNSQLATVCLATRNFRLLQCINDSFFDGYYEVALALLRVVYENYILMEYLKDNENEAKKWLNGKKFAPKFLREQIKDTSGLYGFLSSVYSHNNFQGMIGIIEKFNKKHLDLRYYPFYNKNLCKRCITFSILFSWINASTLQYVFRDTLWKNKKWAKRFYDWNQIFLTYVEDKLIKKTNIKFKFKNKLPSGF